MSHWQYVFVMAACVLLTLPLGIDLPVGAKATLGIRPEDIIVGGTGWPANLTVAEQHGANSYLHCTLQNGEPILVHQQGQSRVERGQQPGQQARVGRGEAPPGTAPGALMGNCGRHGSVLLGRVDPRQDRVGADILGVGGHDRIDDLLHALAP